MSKRKWPERIVVCAHTTSKKHGTYFDETLETMYPVPLDNRAVYVLAPARPRRAKAKKRRR